jgi:hypothetical protein
MRVWSLPVPADKEVLMVSMFRLCRALVPVLVFVWPFDARAAPEPPKGTADAIAMFDEAVDAGLPFRIWVPYVKMTASPPVEKQDGRSRVLRAVGSGAGAGAGISVEQRLPVNLRLSPEVAGVMYAGQLNGEHAIFTRGGDGLHVSLPSSEGVTVVTFLAGRDEAWRRTYPAGEGLVDEPVASYTGDLSIKPGHVEDPLAHTPTFHVFVHDDLREHRVADLHARFTAWWAMDLLKVLPGEPTIFVNYHSRIPWITDMDYEHPDVLDRFAVALRQLSLHTGWPYGKSYKHKFLLLTARPAVAKASGLAVVGQSEATASIQGRVSVVAHEFGHTLGATHEAATSGRIPTGAWSMMYWYGCDTNMHPVAPSTFSCLRYSPANERAIRSYMRHGPVAEQKDVWLERR